MLWKKKKLLNIKYLRSHESTRLLDKQFSITDRDSFSVTVKGTVYFFSKRHDDSHYYIQTGVGQPTHIKVGQTKRIKHADGTYVEFSFLQDFLYSLDYSLAYYAVVVFLMQMTLISLAPKSWFDKKPVVVEKKEEVDQKRVADMLEKLEKKPEPPKPKEKKKPEPPKVVKPEPKPEPKPKPKPQKKVVKKPRPKPQQKVVVEKKPPKRLVTQKGPPKRGGTQADKKKAAMERAARAEARKLAMQKAKAASSLGFLAKGKAAVNVPPGGAANSQSRFIGGRGLAGAKNQTGKASLAAVTGKDVTGASGPISTTGSRNIATGAVISDGEIGGAAGGKALNYVQGKVSARGLHSSKGSGAASFGPSRSMSVSGNINESAVRKAIEAVMGKLQYCYEKGLLAKPSLAGQVQIKWTIVPGGRVSAINVTQSALNDAGVHGCLMGVIKGVKFPSPQGGPATVNYPFDFKSSQL